METEVYKYNTISQLLFFVYLYYNYSYILFCSAFQRIFVTYWTGIIVIRTDNNNNDTMTFSNIFQMTRLVINKSNTNKNNDMLKWTYLIENYERWVIHKHNCLVLIVIIND